jgi:hypothetical protein
MYKQIALGEGSHTFSFPLYNTKESFVVPTEFLSESDQEADISRTVYLRVPQSANYVVFLVGVDDNNISGMGKSPEGSDRIEISNVDMSGGRQYNIFAVGLYRKSGWVSRTGNHLLDYSDTTNRAIISGEADNFTFIIAEDFELDESLWYTNNETIYNPDNDNGYFSVYHSAGGNPMFPGVWYGRRPNTNYTPSSWGRQIEEYYSAVEEGNYGDGEFKKPYKFDALFQNDRFIRSFIENSFVDQWFMMSNSVLYLESKIEKHMSNFNVDLRAITTTPIISRHNAYNVGNSDISIMVGSSELVELSNSQFTNVGNNVYNITVPDSMLEYGNNSISISAKGHVGFVDQMVDSINNFNKLIQLKQDDVLNGLAVNNGLSGYKIDIQMSNGRRINGYVVSSKIEKNGAFLHVAFGFDQMSNFENAQVVLTRNVFDDVFISVEAVRYGVDEIANADFGKFVKNKTTGECTIYDADGNIYRRFSTYVRTNDDGDELFVRDPR